MLELLIALAVVAILAGMAARRSDRIDHSDPLVMVEDSLRRAVAAARAIMNARPRAVAPAYPHPFNSKRLPDAYVRNPRLKTNHAALP